MPLRNKITILFIVTVSGILFAAFAVLYWLRYNANEDEFYNRLQQKAITTAELYVTVEEVDSTLLKRIDRANKDILFKENITIYNHLNKEVYTNNDSIFFQIDQKLLNSIRIENKLKFKQANFKIIGLIYKDDYNNVVAIAGAEDIQGIKRLSSLRNTLFGLYFIILGVVGIIGWLFSGKILQPVTHIINEIDSIYPQNLDKRINTQSNDELDKLAVNFNSLLDRIQQAFRLQQTFITNFSHELKNPLMKMVSQIEVSLMRQRSVKEYQQTLTSVHEDLKELGDLSDSLLELSRLNHSSTSNLLVNVRIDEILFDAREELINSNNQYRIMIDVEKDLSEENELLVIGNPYLLKTTFINLMENGCKFSNNNLTKVTYTTLNQHIQVSFLNNGNGIASKDLPYIFEPFYRANNTSRVKGYGIGLSIVERIVKSHKGFIEIVSTENIETIIKVLLPLANDKTLNHS